jgi:CRISPR/Cas system-associated exonuclease Cas4 (RecB family)
MAFARCPWQFKLNRERALDGAEADRPDVPDEVHSGERGDSAVPPGVDPRTFGTFVHEILRRMTTSGDLDAAIRESLARYDFGKRKDTATATARTLVAHAIQAGLAGPKPGAQAEVPFMVRLDHIMIRGTIDRIDTTESGTVITDYKVGDRSDDHEWQVQTYAWAAAQAGIRAAIGAGVAYLRTHAVEIHEPPMPGHTDRIAHELDGAIRINSFTATPGTPCATCAHRSVCAFAM